MDRQPLTVTYIDPDGGEWPWSAPDSRCRVLSVTGIGGPPTAYTDTALPSGASLPQSYGAAKRSIIVGLHVYDDASQSGLLDLLDQLTFALWTERAGIPAPGRIVLARPNGRSRQIEVFCTSGIEQTDESRDAYQRDTGLVLTFESGLDAMFSDADPIGPLVFEAPPDVGGVPPLLPVVLTPSNTLGETTIVNSGNGDAYPIWTIQGPGTPTLSNLTTGREFSFATLGIGEVVTVDTRPARQSAVDGVGADRWGDLVKTSPRDLWTLVPGKNDLNLEIADAVEGSKIEMVYHRRWLRA
ncbi:hypothetical protein BJF79_03610 [Actinomadura sp. CNU-125]|uniref:hypothetical protein n=1 Tax=Actinomadura sp. CNU-125 TaxID=1904961 RepID=UPI0009692653|nr:hypothetical protein [Actinomadura sp. CNU-125]OLT12999.1 hypothetical protein BJF79_03610 [Actinomadura sp. CNU-125]